MKTINEIIKEFAELVLEKFDDVQSIKIVVENKNKRKIKFKKFIGYKK